MTWSSRIRRSLRGCHLKPSFGLFLFEEEYCLNLFGYFIALPFLDRWHYEPFEMLESWSIEYFESSIYLRWGRYYRFIYMPWSYTFISHEVLRPDNTWAKAGDTYSSWTGDVYTNGFTDGRWYQIYTYTYVLKSGDIQVRQAAVTVDRCEWRQWWLKWTKLFHKVRKSIDVLFDTEVGERTGSWKGGTIGCGYTMKANETAEQTLRHMELEHKFD